nr:MAG TPA: hypothetical protein [Caudoviricetes sp.]
MVVLMLLFGQTLKKFIMETQLKMLIKLVLEMISSTTILKENAKISPF